MKLGDKSGLTMAVQDTILNKPLLFGTRMSANSQGQAPPPFLVHIHLIYGIADLKD
jgi:hypothetical protein